VSGYLHWHNGTNAFYLAIMVNWSPSKVLVALLILDKVAALPVHRIIHGDLPLVAGHPIHTTSMVAERQGGEQQGEHQIPTQTTVRLPGPHRHRPQIRTLIVARHRHGTPTPGRPILTQMMVARRPAGTLARARLILTPLVEAERHPLGKPGHAPLILRRAAGVSQLPVLRTTMDGERLLTIIPRGEMDLVHLLELVAGVQIPVTVDGKRLGGVRTTMILDGWVTPILC
jgi:hypothetical protein